MRMSRGCDLMFAAWPGAKEAFARATMEAPGFALAHLGAAQAAGEKLTGREASHLGFFALMFSG